MSFLSSNLNKNDFKFAANADIFPRHILILLLQNNIFVCVIFTRHAGMTAKIFWISSHVFENSNFSIIFCFLSFRFLFFFLLFKLKEVVKDLQMTNGVTHELVCWERSPGHALFITVKLFFSSFLNWLEQIMMQEVKKNMGGRKVKVFFFLQTYYNFGIPLSYISLFLSFSFFTSRP